MNKRQRTAIEQTIARLKDKNIGANLTTIDQDNEEINKAIETLQKHGYEVVSRLYLETWVIQRIESALPPVAVKPKRR